jgi:hypothetical protein
MPTPEERRDISNPPLTPEQNNSLFKLKYKLYGSIETDMCRIFSFYQLI